MHVFYKNLNLAATNTWVLYRTLTRKAITRRQFIQEENLYSLNNEKFVLFVKQLLKAMSKHKQIVNEFYVTLQNMKKNFRHLFKID